MLRLLKLYLFFTFLLHFSCNQTFFLSNKKHKTQRKDIEKDVIRKNNNRVIGTYRDYRKYKFVINHISKNKNNKRFFNKLNSFSTDKIYGPFFEKDKKLYYIHKSKSILQKSASFQSVQVQQPFGMGDELFQLEINKIMTDCLKSETTLKKVIQNYNSDFEPKFGLVLNFDSLSIKKINPNFVEFIKTAPAYSVYTSDKIENDFITILELYQKISEIMEYDEISFYKIYLQNK